MFFSKKMMNHIKIRMELSPEEIPSEYKELLKSMLIKLEQNLLETTLGDPDEAVYVDNQFVSSAVRTAYSFAVSSVIADFKFSIPAGDTKAIKYALVGKINAKAIDFQRTCYEGDGKKKVSLYNLNRPQYMFQLRFDTKKFGKLKF